MNLQRQRELSNQVHKESFSSVHVRALQTDIVLVSLKFNDIGVFDSPSVPHLDEASKSCSRSESLDLTKTWMN